MKFHEVDFITAVEVNMLNPDFTLRKHRLVEERYRITAIKTSGLPTCLCCISIYGS